MTLYSSGFQNSGDSSDTKLNFSRGPSIERIIDLQDGNSSRNERQPVSGCAATNQLLTTSYASQASVTAYAIEGDPLPDAFHPFYAPLHSRTDCWQQQDDLWTSQTGTTAGLTSFVGGGYYQSNSDYGYGLHPNYSTAAQTYGGYYSSVETPTDGWLSISGNPSSFVGTGTVCDALNDLPIAATRRNAELFHFCEQDQEPSILVSP
jgi:hypothetical protein